MLYREQEELPKYGGTSYRCFCFDNLAKKYEQWMPACYILDITPAELARLMVNEFNATLKWYPETNFMCRSWDNIVDMRNWKNYINRKAREKNFQI